MGLLKNVMVRMRELGSIHLAYFRDRHLGYEDGLAGVTRQELVADNNLGYLEGQRLARARKALDEELEMRKAGFSKA
jgi:hypothetical protein